VFLTAITFLAMEQRINSNFYFKLGKTPIETYGMLQTVCGDEAVSHSSAFVGFKLF
jgi:hypothetical protein